MNAAIWLRVSTEEQNVENQRTALEAIAAARGLTVVRVFELTGVSAFRGEHREALTAMLEMARKRQLGAVLVWALDRLDRGGIKSMLTLIEDLDRYGCALISYQESWVEGKGPFRDIMLAVLAWAAEFESKRKSERIRAGLAVRKARGLPVGRQPGAVDKGGRKRAGYVSRYDGVRKAS